LVSATQGLQNYVEYQFERMGTNRIMVMPSSFDFSGSFEGLTEDDVSAMDAVPGLERISPFMYERVKIEYKKQAEVTGLMAWPSDQSIEIYEDYGLSFVSGKPFETDGSHVVLGYRAAKDLFDKELRVNNRIDIEGSNFKIVGILEEVGNPEDDNVIYMPLETARELLDEPDAVAFIDVKLTEGADVNQAVARIKRELERRRDEKSFQVLTAEQLLEQFGEILGVIQAVLVAVGGISLIVGAVGIANSMYTSVLQRRKEIGIMKSIGARNKDVVLLFLVESGLLGLVGGVFGVIIGALIANLVGVVAANAGYAVFRIEIGASILLFGISFATLVGMLAGALPAKSAAKLNPVDALRS
ncbi:ABC transporter permease, partial [Candidatus Woesearchaeota archaeon]|nr:ABC transporter permease [Candidatus Woesearchaeota archaeon]